jgi:hypothetical protein
MESPAFNAESLLQASVALSSHRPETRPEGRLMLAVLEQALRDLEVDRRLLGWRRSRRRSGGVLTAEAWFAGSGTSWPYSFECLCEHLGLDAASIRRTVGIAAR